FSSRRRHTRFSRDWSSDVCSSDLLVLGQNLQGNPFIRLQADDELVIRKVFLVRIEDVMGSRFEMNNDLRQFFRHPLAGAQVKGKIGRASCRETGEVTVGAGGLQER